MNHRNAAHRSLLPAGLAWAGMGARHLLQIVVSRDCLNCEQALEAAREIARRHAELEVQVIDLDREAVPEAVFAVPTYLLDGRVVSLGNPDLERLEQKVAEVLEGG